MHTLFTHASCLVGLLVFMKQAWSYAPLDRAVLLALGTGLTVYLLLVFGSALVRRIMAYDPPGEAQSDPPNREKEAAPASASNNASASASESDAASNVQTENANADQQTRQQQPVASPMV